MIRKLRAQFAIVCTLLTGVVLLGSLLVAYRLSLSLHSRNSEKQLSQHMTVLATQVRYPAYIDLAQLTSWENKNQLLIRIEDAGIPLQHRGHSDERECSALFGDVRQYAEANGINLSWRPTANQRLIIPSLTSGGVEYRGEIQVRQNGKNGWINLMILQSFELQHTEARRLLQIYTAIFLLGLALLTLISRGLAGLLTKPVQMAQQKQSEFIAAASHELRTPLSVISSSTEMAMQNPRQAAHYLNNILEETRRMAGLTTDLLMLAGADAGKMAVRLGAVAPDTLLIEAYGRYQPLAAKSGHILKLSLPDEHALPVYVDEERIMQLIGILLSNSFTYAPPGTTVELFLQIKKTQIAIGVADHGQGVPDSEKPRIFERFYRGDQSHSARNHYGLGLCVAKQILDCHDAIIELEDTPGGGATFTCLFQRI